MKLSFSSFFLFVAGVVAVNADDEPDQKCTTLLDTLDGLGSEYSMFTSMMAANTIELSAINMDVTIFVPSDAAFEEIKTSIGDAMDEITDAEKDRIFDFHFYPGRLTFDELACSETLTSLNAEKDQSRTMCDKGHGADVKHQNGNGNTKQGSLPTIDTQDIFFCNGVIHLVDHILLPVHLEELVDTPVGSANHKNMMRGGNYCTYAPDNSCYESGWPSCCASGSSGSCPDTKPKCDGQSYCVYAPDTSCYDGGWPECCLDESKGCPSTKPACDKGAAYCVWGPNFDCYVGGWPECCLEDYQGCPTEYPKCEVEKPPVGASYCTYSPDSTCYTQGWPECCLNDKGASCPSKQPGCDYQCGRDCSGTYDCSQPGGVWDPGMPWCGGICEDGACQPNFKDCSNDSDCGDRAVCSTNGYCVGKSLYTNQCARNCESNYDCQQTDGIWDTGSPWCGLCKEGHCRATIAPCSSDSDCDSDKSVCGPGMPGGGRYCVGK